MADFTISHVPDEDLSALDARAARHGHSREEEVRRLIHRAAMEEKLVGELDRKTREVEARIKRTDARGATSHSRARRRHVEPTPARKTDAG